MDKNIANISSIETFFCDLLGKNVSENVFFTDLPPAIKQEWQDMVVVDIPNTIRDLDAYGSGIVLIYLYAKPLSTGTKNVARISLMERELNKCIVSNMSPNYVISKYGEYSDYDPVRNLHCNIIELNVTII